MLHLIIAGDICPMGSIEKSFIEGVAVEIYHDLLDDIKNADLSIANLECPLIVNRTPTLKAGPILGADIKCVKGLKAGGWTAINLANNHSFDHGVAGLTTTIDTLKQSGMFCFGAGMNVQEAQEPFIDTINGNEIVIYSMAEREFSVATDTMPGSNPLDIINIVTAIKKYKKNNIFILLLHGGVEYYSFPSPQMVRRCRFMIDMGADAVICCHSHCPQPWEIYNGKPIIYGLGNFIFEAVGKKPDIWYKGYLAELTINGTDIQFRPIPYFQSLHEIGAKKMVTTQYDNFIKYMRECNQQLNQKQFLETQWINYCKKKEKIYLSYLFGYRRILRKFFKFLMPLLHPLDAILNSLLLVRSESHQEKLDTILQFYCQRHRNLKVEQ